MACTVPPFPRTEFRFVPLTAAAADGDESAETLDCWSLLKLKAEPTAAKSQPVKAEVRPAKATTVVKDEVAATRPKELPTAKTEAVESVAAEGVRVAMSLRVSAGASSSSASSSDAAGSTATYEEQLRAALMLDPCAAQWQGEASKS